MEYVLIILLAVAAGVVWAIREHNKPSGGMRP